MKKGVKKKLQYWKNKNHLQPDKGRYLSFDHLTFYVGNAKQAASYYVTRLGFEYLAYQGLETGHREYAKHVVKQNNVRFTFRIFFSSRNEFLTIQFCSHFSLLDRSFSFL